MVPQGNGGEDSDKRSVPVVIPRNHPRRKSLEERHALEKALLRGIVTPTGMAAHGRGEAFDYLLGEKTWEFAKRQAKAAAAQLLLAKRPMITVNGNTTALCAREITALAKAIPAGIEVNLFYRTRRRARLIEKEFARHGAKIMGVEPKREIPGLASARRHAEEEGTWVADAVLVMLEDGDRAEALAGMGKAVIAVDLNPLSRTARTASITIVDNVTRAVPLLTREVRRLRMKSRGELERLVGGFDNARLLSEAERAIRQGFSGKAVL